MVRRRRRDRKRVIGVERLRARRHMPPEIEKLPVLLWIERDIEPSRVTDDRVVWIDPTRTEVSDDSPLEQRHQTISAFRE